MYNWLILLQNSDHIWTQVRQDVVRLSAGATLDLSPQDIIRVTTDTESGSIYAAANKFGIGYNTVLRHRRFVATALAFALAGNGLLPDSSEAIDRLRYDQLIALHKEADIIAKVTGQFQVARLLGQMPDLKSLLFSYQQFSTVEPLLKENMVPHNPEQIRQFNCDLRSYLFGHKTNLQIRPLLRKISFSRWLYRGTNWYDNETDDIVEGLNRASQVVAVQQSNRKDGHKVYSMKTFLVSVIARELSAAVAKKYDLNDAFASKNGNPVINLDNVDVASTFGLFSDAYYFPDTFREFMSDYVEGATSVQSRNGLAVAMSYKDLVYADCSKKRWISQGLVFLENALNFRYRPRFFRIKNKSETAPSYPNLEKLTFDRREALRQFRVLFQRNLQIVREEES